MRVNRLEGNLIICRACAIASAVFCAWSLGTFTFSSRHLISEARIVSVAPPIPEEIENPESDPEPVESAWTSGKVIVTRVKHSVRMNILLG
jgi:hypothetical protein